MTISGKKKKLWRKQECIPQRSSEKCPNYTLCDDRETKSEKLICESLAFRLGLYTEEQLQEKEVQKIIRNNLANIDWGVEGKLQYYDHELPIGIGRPDILLQDSASKTLYVIELKSRIASRGDIGQLLSYVGWYKKNMPSEFRAVKGILCAIGFDDGAKYALKESPNIKAKTFRLNIAIGNPEI